MLCIIIYEIEVGFSLLLVLDRWLILVVVVDHIR